MNNVFQTAENQVKRYKSQVIAPEVLAERKAEFKQMFSTAVSTALASASMKKYIEASVKYELKNALQEWIDSPDGQAEIRRAAKGVIREYQ